MFLVPTRFNVIKILNLQYVPMCCIHVNLVKHQGPVKKHNCISSFNCLRLFFIHLIINLAMFQITGDTILERLPYFMNLKYLSFHTLFTKSSTLLSMFCVLRNAPNVEGLHITVVYNCTSFSFVLSTLTTSYIDLDHHHI
jgi:hypothetical protein